MTLPLALVLLVSSFCQRIGWFVTLAVGLNGSRLKSCARGNPKRQLAVARGGNGVSTGFDPSDPHDPPGVSERSGVNLNALDVRLRDLEVSIGEIKGEIRGLKHAQVAVFAVLALIVMLMVYMLTRIDDLPKELNAIANTLSNAITASQSREPVIINLPAPIVVPDTSSVSPSRPE